MTLQSIRGPHGIERPIRGAHDLERWLRVQVCNVWLDSACQPVVRRIHDTPSLDRQAVARAVSGIQQPLRFEDTQIYSARMQFAYALSELPYVTEAWSAAEEGVTFIWVFIDEDSTHARRQVFNAEQQVMDKFPDREFDFYVFSSQCRDAFADEGRQAEQFYVRG